MFELEDRTWGQVHPPCCVVRYMCLKYITPRARINLSLSFCVCVARHAPTDTITMLIKKPVGKENIVADSPFCQGEGKEIHRGESQRQNREKEKQTN